MKLNLKTKESINRRLSLKQFLMPITNLSTEVCIVGYSGGRKIIFDGINKKLRFV
jgi:nickel-dependent lactate racemase